MSVIGFDIGNLNCYIAVANKGGIEVITNDYSLHATPGCVAFGPKGRSMGVAARQAVNTNFKNTIMNFKHLIGRKFSDPITQLFLPFIPCQVIQLPDDNIGMKVSYLGREEVFTPEQVLGALLTKLRTIVEAQMPEIKKVTDCVLAVPFYFTDAQRRAVLASVETAKLNSLRIMNETTALALAYGIYKADLPEEGAEPKKVLFLDFGHSNTQACVAAFHKGKLMMLGATYDMAVGGLWLDTLIREHFREEFKQKYGIDAKESPRAWLRLLDESEKTKKQMSANQTPIPLNIECFMNDKDVSGKMQRSEFELLAAPLFDKLRALLKNLLAQVKLQPNNIDEVEIVGGSSRIPMVRQIVKEIFNKEAKTTMNQDESVARGSAMQCAVLSPSFRVRDFAIKDQQPHRIRLSWSSVGAAEAGESDVFMEQDEFPYSKMLTLYRTGPFRLDAGYALPNAVPYSKREIGSWQVNGVVPESNGDSRKVKVKVRVNPNGIFSVCTATMYETQLATLKDDEKMESDPPAIPTAAEGETPMETSDTPSQKDGWKKEKKAREKKEAEKKEEAKKKKEAEKKKDMEKKKEEVEKKKDIKMEESKIEDVGETDGSKSKTKTVAIDLPITEHIPVTYDVKKFAEAEMEMQRVDLLEKKKADAKNAVEEYVYDMRNKVSDQLGPFVTEADADVFRNALSESEEWLYGDGEEAETEVYEARLASLKTLGDPISERHKEWVMRQFHFDQFDQVLFRARKAYEDYVKGGEKYAHLDSKDMDKVISTIEDRKRWLDDVRHRQENRPKVEPPIVFIQEIVDKKSAFENIVNPILSKPKPKVEEPPAPAGKPKSSPKNGNAKGASADGDGQQKDGAPPADMEVD